MIRHISRIATTTQRHDLGYGFLLTLVFERFGVELQNRLGAQVIDEIGSSTLMGCGFDLVQAKDTDFIHRVQHLLLLFPVALQESLPLPRFNRNNSGCKMSFQL